MDESTEYFVDQVEKPIPSQDKWHELSVSELIDVKNQIADKMYSFQGQAVIQKVLAEAYKRISAMLGEKV
jgi:hypothetical protein